MRGQITCRKAHIRTRTRRALSINQTVQSPAKKSENPGTAVVRVVRTATTGLSLKTDAAKPPRKYLNRI
jgi:hypothetical protein